MQQFINTDLKRVEDLITESVNMRNFLFIASDYSYLERMRLCARTNVQSFIDEDEGQVKQVCRGAGYRVTTGGNLCISQSNMKVYDVESEGTNIDCTVSRVTKGVHKVVLACDKVNNNCAPVHYQNRRGYQASRQVCS